jgi:hypothetical protein
MRTHYGPWQPCWISNQHQKHKFGRGPSNEHFWQVWLKSAQWFQRRFKCEKLTDGRTTEAYPWQKLTWPMARWAKNKTEKVWRSLKANYNQYIQRRQSMQWQNVKQWSTKLDMSNMNATKTGSKLRLTGR